jgi:glycosyltransferase involved in cell wall biosynthesis
VVNKSLVRINRPLITVIVPSYNHEPFLATRLRSISEQSYKNIEIILLDDASDDNSVDTLEKFKQCEKRVVHTDYSSENSGQTNSQWIKGVEKAQGDFIWIAESDDVAKPDFLAVLLEEFVVNENIALAYCDSLIIDKQGSSIGGYDYASKNYKNIWDKSFIKDGTELIRDYFVFSNVIPNVSAVLFKKEHLQKALVVNDFKYCGDWSCYIRLAIKYKISFVSQKLNQFRQHENTTRNHDVKSYNVALKEKISLLRLIRDSGINDCSRNIEISLSQVYLNRDKHRRISKLINILDKEHTAKHTVLYGYNDICGILMKGSKNKRKIIAILDQNRAGENCMGVPVVNIKSIDFRDIDVVVICSLSHREAMSNELTSFGFEGVIIAV